MTTNNKTLVTCGNRTIKLNWSLYNSMMRHSKGSDFRSVRLRLALCLIAITGASINQILRLKVQNLRTLNKASFIRIDNQTLLIKNPKVRQILDQRREDIEFICKRKNNKDYIFTKDINSQIPLRRETFTRLVNQNLNEFGVSLSPPLRLTSKSLKNLEWDESI